MSVRKYHHIGIPTTESKDGEYFVPEWKVSLTPYDISKFHVQWCRYHEGCVLPELVKTVPHVAFIVDDMEEELEGKKIIYGPYTPADGWRVVFIEECGAPIELIETNLTEDQVRNLERKHFTEEGAASPLPE
jgi:hypothetical protein